MKAKGEYDALIVGCGITGSVIARHLAEKGKKVLMWERRDHVGGNMYDYVDDNGIIVHKYGPHVFHTNDKSLKDYVEQYGKWTEFNVNCRVEMLGKLTPSPFNFQTIDDYYEKEEAENLKKKLLEYYGGRDEATIVELLSCEDEDIKRYADFLFKNDYSLYTVKQWGISPDEIDPSVLKRVPVYFSYKDGCFEDTYQMVPIEGYTEWFRNLLNHENITIEFGQDALLRLNIVNSNIRIDENEFGGTVIYTGPIDELFDCKYGSLPYRSLTFRWEYEEGKRHQPTPLVVNPAAKEYTRVTEYAYFPHKRIDNGKSSYAYECPVQYERGTGMEPYYPIQTVESSGKYEEYASLAERIPNLVCAGRLAKFKYYNMDQALAAALEVCTEIDNKGL